MDTSLVTATQTVNAPSNGYDPRSVEAFINMLDHGSAAGVTEIRIVPKEPYLNIKGRRTYVGKTVVGYYEPDKYLQAANDIAPFDGNAQIYICLNPCRSELLARSANRLQFNAQHTATDADILCLQWFRVDCDPVRPSGISASDTELEQSILLRDVIAADLESYGAPVIKAMSGNGGHLLVRLPDYPNDESHSTLIKSITKRIAAEWSDDVVNVDTTVSNPARIWKVYGTMAAKGDNVPNRPHRRATIELPEGPVPPFDLRQLPHVESKPFYFSELQHFHPNGTANNGGSNRARAYALGALKREVEIVKAIPDGQKHGRLLRSSVALAGFVPSGALSSQEIEEGLFNAVQDRADDPKRALRTIQDGVRYGSTRPREIPEEKFSSAPAKTLKNQNNPPSESNLGLLGSYPDAFEKFQTDPQPIVPKLRPVPALLPQLLPIALRNWITDITDRISCPLEFAAGPAIVALASLVGRKIGIRPKRFDDWTVVPNLWGASIGSPGSRKTPAASEAMKPLRRLEAEAIEVQRQATEAFSAEMQVVEAQAKAAKDALQKAARKKDVSKADLHVLAQDVIPVVPTQPVEKRYKLNDSTVEALGERLKENPNGLLVYRDELTGFTRTLDKQGHENDRAFYLESWNGTEENYYYDRIGRGTVRLPTVCLSLFGTIQPGPLSRFLRGAASGEEADGLIPRFQILFYPNQPCYAHVDRYPNNDAKNRAFDVFTALDNLEAETLGAEVESGSSIPFLRFASDAQQFFNEWLTHLESEKLPQAESTPLIESHLAKYRSLMSSLSLLFHLIDVVDGAPGGAVSLRAAQMAAAWCDVLEAHARRIYQIAYEGGLDSALSLAERIKDGSVHKLRNSDGTRFKIGDVVQRGWSSLSKTEDVNRAVAFLEERNWLQMVEIPAGVQGGRPEQWVYLHPKFLHDRKREGGEQNEVL